MKLKTLAIFTGGLFVLSLLVFWNEGRRGTDLVAGSDYIRGLDIEKVAKMAVSFKEGKKISLAREEGQFVIESHQSYPADTQKVNDLIYKVASITVQQRAKSKVSEEDLEKYELGPKSRHYLVEFFDRQGGRTVAFRVGKNRAGKGNYLFKEGGDEVYVSESSLWFSSSPQGLVDDVLLELEEDELARVALKGVASFEKQDKDYASGLKGFKKEKAVEYLAGIKKVRFDEYFSAGDGEVAGLKFGHALEVELRSGLIYELELAQKKKPKKEDKQAHFARIRARVREGPDKILIKKDDGQEKLKGVEAMVLAQGKAQEVNRTKGRWVYKIDQATFEKIVKKAAFFQE